MDLSSALGLALPLGVDTGENGRAIFRDLQSGKYSLSIDQKGFEPIKRDLDLTPGGPTRLDLILQP